MSDLKVVPGNQGFGLMDHIKAIDDRLGRIEMKLFGGDSSGSFYGEQVPTDFPEDAAAKRYEQWKLDHPEHAPVVVEAADVQHEDSQSGQ